MKKSRKSIYVITETLDVDSTSAGRANLALVSNLISAGFKVDVAVCFEPLPQGLNGDVILEKRSGFHFLVSRFVRVLRRKFNINLSPFLESKLGFSQTFFSETKSLAANLKENDFLDDYDLIITLSQGSRFTTHHALLKLPGLHHKWLAYVHDPYPFAYYPKPYKWNEPGALRKIAFMQNVFNKAAIMGYPSTMLEEWMNEKYGKPNVSIVIPHQLVSEPTKTNFSPSENIKLVHAGNLLEGRNPLPLIQILEKINVNEPKESVELIIIGSLGVYQESLLKLQQKHSWLTVLESVPFKEALSYQKAAAVNVVIEAEDEGLSPFLPGKIPHCINSGNPILYLGPAKSETLAILGEDYIYKFSASDEKKGFEVVQRLIADLKLQGNAFKFSQELIDYFSPVFLKKQINSVLDEIR